MSTCNSFNWGTPANIMAGVRYTLRTIDLDPASSVGHNRTVGAKKIFTKEDDGLRKYWFGRIFLNPPGDLKGLQKKFYETLARYYFEGMVTSAIYYGYSLEQLRWVQDYKDLVDPMEHPICILRKRPQHLDECGVPSKGSGFNGAFVMLLTEDVSEEIRFFNYFRDLGMVL